MKHNQGKLLMIALHAIPDPVEFVSHQTLRQLKLLALGPKTRGLASPPIPRECAIAMGVKATWRCRLDQPIISRKSMLQRPQRNLLQKGGWPIPRFAAHALRHVRKHFYGCRPTRGTVVVEVAPCAIPDVVDLRTHINHPQGS